MPQRRIKDNRSRIKDLKNKKKKEFTASPFQAFIVISPLIVLVLFILGVFYFASSLITLKRVNMMPKILNNKEYNFGRQYPISAWKTYRDRALGLSIKYPSLGYIQDPECFKKGICNGKVHLATCGTAIKDENWTKSSQFISFDNMFGIIINNFNGTIDEFIKSQGGNPSDFTTTSENVSGAADAAFVKLAKTTDSMTPPVPSIMTPAYIIRKGSYIFQIAPLQNFGSKTGCLPPAGTKANSFDSKYWNIPQSITFN